MIICYMKTLMIKDITYLGQKFGGWKGSNCNPHNSTANLSAWLHFQGPALYAYNDAYFEEKDWEGIRMLGESLKEKDPIKVGKFGLGFKSVFHMTGRFSTFYTHDLL